jgi:geranylgeranylglycerol-phosphate geranylgeranyltransferase
MKVKKLLLAWGRMIRLPIMFLCSFGALVSALNCAVHVYGFVDLSLFQMVMILLVPAFLSTGIMIHNDVPDLESDRINRPYKPLPSGIIKVRTAFITGLTLMFLSIILSLFINIGKDSTLNWNCALLTTILVVIGLYYNYRGKYHGIFGHMAVAFGVGAIPYWGGIAAFPHQPLLMLPLAIAIFSQEIGREIMVCAGDYLGDLKAGWKTTPVNLGRKRSMYVALFFYLLFIPLFPLPAFDWIGLGVPQIFGTVYLIGGFVLACSLLLTWFLTYIAVLTNDEKKIWNAFEKYERTGTRLLIIIFQIFLLVEVFY